MPPLEAITTRRSMLLSYSASEDNLVALPLANMPDIIAVDGDPLEDIRVLGHVRFVIKRRCCLPPCTRLQLSVWSA